MRARGILIAAVTALSHLESVIVRLESRANYRIDNLRYLQRIFIDAMNDPLFPGNACLPSESIDKQGIASLWISEMPLPHSNILSTDDGSSLVKHELYSLRKIQDLFPWPATPQICLRMFITFLAKVDLLLHSLQKSIRFWCASYNPRRKEGSFALASPLLNPTRRAFWTRQDTVQSSDTLINGSVPVDFRGEWIGLLGIAITDESIKKLLSSLLPANTHQLQPPDLSDRCAE